MRPVIFLHGLGQTPQSWQDQVVALPSGTPMFAPWLPGVRPGDDQAFELDAATEELRQFIELQGIEKVRIVGHGLGGLVATRLAARYPEVITGVVLSGPQLRPSKMALRMQATMLRLAPLRAFSDSADLKRRAIEAVKALGEVDPAADLAAVDCPTLVIIGDSDKLGKAAAEQIRSMINDAELITVPGGAQPNTEDPAAFNAALVEFLEKTDS